MILYSLALELFKQMMNDMNTLYFICRILLTYITKNTYFHPRSCSKLWMLRLHHRNLLIRFHPETKNVFSIISFTNISILPIRFYPEISFAIIQLSFVKTTWKIAGIAKMKANFSSKYFFNDNKCLVIVVFIDFFE